MNALEQYTAAREGAETAADGGIETVGDGMAGQREGVDVGSVGEFVSDIATDSEVVA